MRLRVFFGILLVITILFLSFGCAQGNQSTVAIVLPISTQGDLGLPEASVYFYTDGVDDQETINQAINFVSTNGANSQSRIKGTVIILGEMYLSNSIILRSNLELRGVNARLRMGNNAPYNIIRGENVSHVIISGLELDGNKGNNIWNVAGAYEWEQNGILVRRGNDFVIENNFIHDTWYMGAFFYDVYNSLVQNNTFTDIPITGLEVAGGKYNIITGNHFIRCGQSASGPTGAQGAFESYAMSNSILSYNIFTETPETHAILARNGIWDSVISNNIIDGGLIGIEFQGDKNKFTDNILSNNIIRVNNTGIRLATSLTVEVKRNLFKDNIIKSVNEDYLTNYGISVSSGSYNNYEDNTIYTARVIGIRLVGQGHNKVSNNFILNSGWDTQPDGAGIYLGASESYNVIKDNYISDSLTRMRYGIREMAGASANRFVGNDIFGYVLADMLLEGK